MKRLTLLAVDDEPEILEIITMTFEEHRVVTALNTRSALEILASTSCDVLITDINMPGASGLALIDEAAQIKPGMPVVVITGRRWEPPLSDGRNVFRCLAKPFRIADLRHAVEAAAQSLAPETVR